MIKDVKCPNCEEKDRVTIAGRVFCVNCGTPWEDTDRDDAARPALATQSNNPAPISINDQPINVDPPQPIVQSMPEPKIIPAQSLRADTGIKPVQPSSPLDSFDDVVAPSLSDAVSSPAPQSMPAPIKLPPIELSPTVLPARKTAVEQIENASTVSQSQQVNKFSAPVASPNTVTEAPLPPAPRKTETVSGAQPVAAPQKPSPQSPITSPLSPVATAMPTVAVPKPVSSAPAVQQTPVAPIVSPAAQIQEQPQPAAPVALAVPASTPVPVQPPVAIPVPQPIVSSAPAAQVLPQSAPQVAVVQPPTPAIPAVQAPAPVTQPPMAAPSVLAPPTENLGSEITSLDSKDESVLSDEAFNNLSNSPNMISAKLKKVATTQNQFSIQPAAQVAPSSPPPFVPPSAPLTASSMTVIPNTSMVDIRPANSAPVQPAPAPVVQPVSAPAPSAPPFSPPPTSPNRIMSDISPVKTQLNGAAVLPTGSQLNIHPSHSFLAEPGVAAMSSSTPAEDTAAKEQALKMALSSVTDQGAPQIGASFKPANVALSLVAVALIGFYIWQVNYPNLAIKVAAAKSGVTATVPGYLPSGWKIGKNINATDGSLSYNVINPSSNKSVLIIQSKSDWDSQALAENYVTAKYPDYSAFQAQGLTVYMYGNNQASWVNNGNWFRVEGETGALSQDQVIKMATSL